MSKTLKNVLLGIAVAVIFCFRIAGKTAAFDLAFYIGILAMAAVEGLYLLLNRKELEENERINELFYLCGIGVVLLCKVLIF